jgi:ribosomal protein S4E
MFAVVEFFRQVVSMLYKHKSAKNSGGRDMTIETQNKLKGGNRCSVNDGTHKGKSGIVRDINTSKTGHLTITVVQSNGERFKTLAKNVVIQA